jgi:Potassium-transporting ATPase A subunit/Transcriptional regulatory protein, C terminal
VKPLGLYMAKLFDGERTWLSPLLAPLERGIYRLCGVDDAEEQHWTQYTIAMLAFSIAGFVSLYALQRLQALLPLNPQGMGGVTPDLAFNTSISFITNTNWQSYGGETDLAVDLVRRIVTVRDAEVKLTPREYDLLRLLIAHAGKVLTHKLILREVWGGESDVQYLRIYIRTLRQKLEAEPEQPRLILTEQGVGYRLRAGE